MCQAVALTAKLLQRKPDLTIAPLILARPTRQERPTNLILAAIAPDEYESVRSVLTAQPLRMRETLQEAGEPPEFVYFPTSGIISALTVMENGMMIEFATVGREGTTGVPPFLGMGDSNMALVSQLPGESLRMTIADFREPLVDSRSLAAIVGRYSGVMLALVAQSAACNRAHNADERCARWLLITHDQSASDQFPITHEFLA
jgi:CRP-like cAMP-binding protein